MSRIHNIIEKQKEFQRSVGFPIDSITESDRNEMSEKYVFKLIEEAVELRKEFPSVMNPWSKKQKPADIQRVKEEFADVVLFLTNLAIVWKLSPDDILEIVEYVQGRNFTGLKKRMMDLLNSDILKIPGRISGIGSGNLSPKYVFVGQNPGKNITQGYKFWSDLEEGSSKILLPILEEYGVLKDCYFTNVVKCVTTNNEEPSIEMTDFYSEFLLKELEVLKISNPDVKIIAMGQWTSAQLDKLMGKRVDSIPHPASMFYGGDLEMYKKQIHDKLT